MHQMIDAAIRGDLASGRNINNLLLPLHQRLFLEANPIPVKWAVARMGLAGGALRLPMTPMSAQHVAAIEEAMRQAGIKL